MEEKYYFAKDGNYGSARGLEVVDTSDWTDEDWTAVEEASDTERVATVRRIQRKYKK